MTDKMQASKTFVLQKNLSLVGSLKEHSINKPNEIAINIVDPKCEIVRSLTYQKLWSDSEDLTKRLVGKFEIKKGDRVMMVFPINEVIEYITTFVALLRIGAIPVSVYPPNPSNLTADLKKFNVFVENAGSSHVITTKTYKQVVNMTFLTHSWPKSLHWITMNEPEVTKFSLFSICTPKRIVNVEDCLEPSDKDVAFIQYTSGSTGNPKGVPIHYGSMNHTMNFMAASGLPTKQVDTLIWVPIYHDYGLITLISVLYFGTRIYILDPISFIKDPLIWPRAIEKFQIHTTVGPNFSYALVSKKLRERPGLKFNVSSLGFANLGAEPIQKSTVESMIEVWGVPKQSITHGYGFAESCLLITQGPADFDEETGIAASGSLELSAEWGYKVVIADKETKKPLPDGETGEIFVQGPGIVKEYWKNPEATKEAFKNEIEGHSGYWYMTGDLGYIKDKKIYVSGRSKDVLIINGRNVYATDIESALETELNGIIRPGCSAAFQTGDYTAAVICEFKPGQEKEVTEERLLEVKNFLDKSFELQITHIYCCQKGTVPKTTSGKIRRSIAKKEFLDSKFKPVLAYIGTIKFAALEDMLDHYGAKDRTKTLLENGIDSVRLLALKNDAKDQFDVDFDMDIAYSMTVDEILKSVSRTLKVSEESNESTLKEQ